ncbi:MAG: DUF6544 family protein [Acidimicrobiales bacterium]
MEFRLHGLVPVAQASGPDVARSAAGRLAAETVAWVPQALTPQAGAVDDEHAVVKSDFAGETVDVEVGGRSRWPGGRARAAAMEGLSRPGRVRALERLSRNEHTGA